MEDSIKIGEIETNFRSGFLMQQIFTLTLFRMGEWVWQKAYPTPPLLPHY